MSEKIKKVKTHFFLVLGVGTFELKSFHLAGHLTSDLVPDPGARKAISKVQMLGD